MAKGPSKARESRVNIAITDKLKGGAEPELPFRMLVMGDYTLKDDDRAVYEACLAEVQKDPKKGHARALRWRREVGGAAATHCAI